MKYFLIFFVLFFTKITQADVKISALPQIAGASTTNSDVMPIVTFGSGVGVTSKILLSDVKAAAGAISIGVKTDSTTSSIFNNTSNNITGSPLTNPGGNMTLTLSNQAKNLFLAGPTTGSNAAPAFRALSSADLPAFLGTNTLASSNLVFTDSSGNLTTTVGNTATYFLGDQTGGGALTTDFQKTLQIGQGGNAGFAHHYIPIFITNNVPSATGASQVLNINTNTVGTDSYSMYVVGSSETHIGEFGYFNAGMTGAGFYGLSSIADTTFLEGAGAGGLLVFADTAPVYFGSGAVSWQINTNGNFTPYADATYDNGSPTLKNRRIFTWDTTTGIQAVSASSAGSATFNNYVKNMVLTASGTLTSYTVTMPPAPDNGQEVVITCNKAITALTVSPNSGQSVVGGSFAPAIGTATRFIYVTANTTWYPQ